METNHEKFLRLRKQYKWRVARKELIEKYQADFHISIAENAFYDIDQNHESLKKVYHTNKSLERYKEYIDYENVMVDIRKLYEKLIVYKDNSVYFQYFYSIEGAGGCRITLAECWSIIEQITMPALDIIVTAEDFAFGFCVEVDEHSYFLFRWGC